MSAAIELPPHDLRAERALLGAMLIERKAIESAFGVGLNYASFYSPALGSICWAISKLYTEGHPVDAVLVAAVLEEANLLDEVGGPVVLLDLQQECPATSNARAYAERIVDRWTKRQLIQVGQDIARDAAEGREPSATTLERLDSLRHQAAVVGEISGLIDWATAWDRDEEESCWLVEPIVPGGGRACKLYSTKGAGKSDLLLWLAAHLALGRPVLDSTPKGPVRVLYIDNEMVLGDVLDRLESFGFGPDDDLSPLAYYCLPDIAKLNTGAGAAQLLSLVDKHGAELVIIDTVARMMDGKENDVEPSKEFSDRVTTELKRRGVSSLLAGHAGKDIDRGERGTSENGAIEELIWQLTRDEEGVVTLKAEKRRSRWMTLEKVKLHRPKRDGLLTWALLDAGKASSIEDIPKGSMETAKLLDGLGLPLDVSYRAAAEALKEADQGRRAEVVRGALKYRKWAASKRPKKAAVDEDF